MARYVREGVPNDPTPAEIAWCNGLLINQTGRARNVILVTDGPDGTGRSRARSTPLAAGFTRHSAGKPDGKLRQYWVSDPRDFHSLHIEGNIEIAKVLGRPAMAEVSLVLGDSSSGNVYLQMQAMARELPPEQQAGALRIVTGIRRATGVEPAEPVVGSLSMYHVGRRAYEAIITSAVIQGMGYRDGLPAQEDHPVVPLDRLIGHVLPPDELGEFL